MKKLTVFLLMLVFCSVGTSYAQVEQISNKNGVDIMPEAGQFAIGFDALPFFRFAGNMFNGNTNNNNANANWANNWGGTVFGKYFLTESMAVRGRFMMNQSTTQDVNRVTLDGQAIPQSNIQVEDQRINHNFDIMFGGGIEFRRSKGRIVGVYGGELFVGTAASNSKYTYGNTLTETNQTPGTSNFFDANLTSGGYRVLSRTNPNNFRIGAQAFAGIEYFFAPQISVGAEFYLGINYLGRNRTDVITEEWDGLANERLEITRVGAGTLTQFGVATGNWGGNINLMFHF
jgi:hypothetical protein